MAYKVVLLSLALMLLVSVCRAEEFLDEEDALNFLRDAMQREGVMLFFETNVAKLCLGKDFSLVLFYETRPTKHYHYVEHQIKGGCIVPVKKIENRLYGGSEKTFTDLKRSPLEEPLVAVTIEQFLIKRKENNNRCGQQLRPKEEISPPLSLVKPNNFLNRFFEKSWRLQPPQLLHYKAIKYLIEERLE